MVVAIFRRAQIVAMSSYLMLPLHSEKKFLGNIYIL